MNESQKHDSAFAFRQDLPGYTVPHDRLVEFHKMMSELNKAAKADAKPEACYICGEEMPKFCNSHTVPQYCLREIADNGKLLTTSALMGGNLLDSEIGIKDAATFKQVCRKCDTEYFKLYETPETLLSEPTSQVLGQIAAKNLLREISKARLELGLRNALGNRSTAGLDAMTNVRAVDAAEDEKAFDIAIRVGKSNKSSSAYHLIFYRVLPYVAPFAFQQMISPISDFEGGMINNAYNPSANYRMEPMHLCVLPTKGQTVVLAFRSEKANRYRDFEKQLRMFSEDQILQSIVKLIFAYSEDVLLSRKISPKALNDDNLAVLSRMNHNYFGFGDSPEEYRRITLKTALSEFAIDNLPEPPALLSEDFSL